MTQRAVTFPEPIRDAFVSSLNRSIATQPAWLIDIRRAAFDAAVSLGWPNTRHEEWRYTPLSALTSTAWNSGSAPLVATTESKSGTLRVAKLSELWKKESSLCSMSQFLETASRLARQAPDTGTLGVAEQTWSREDVMSHLAMAFFEDGYLVEAATQTEGTVTINSSNLAPSSLVAPLILVRANSLSHVKVIEIDSNRTATQTLRFPTTLVLAAQNANVTHLRIQSTAKGNATIATTRYLIEKNARVTSLVSAAGTGLFRSNLGAALLSEGAQIVLRGLGLLSDAGPGAAVPVVDHHTSVDHLAPQTKSNQLYKSVLTGKTRSVFNGKIFVRKGAAGAAAFQTNKNLLVGDEAEVNTKPQLEIDTDDVQCSHGATVGQINDDELFYLRSRGIPAVEARTLLAEAFAAEVLENVANDEVNSLLHQEVRACISDSSLHNLAPGGST